MISGGTVGKVMYGVFAADGSFSAEGEAAYDGVLKMRKGVIYDIAFSSSGKSVSDTKTLIGTLYE